MEQKTDNFARRGNKTYEKEKIISSVASSGETEINEESKLDFDIDTRSFGEDFPVVFRSVTTTKDICGLIGQIISAVFKDYDGCFIEVEPVNGIPTPMLSVYFKTNFMGGDGIMNAIEDIDQKRRDGSKYQSGYDSISAYNAQFNRRRYQLTKNAELIFQNYIHDSRIKYQRNRDGSLKKKSINWNQATVETNENNRIQNNPYFPAAANNILFKVRYLDLVKFMKKIYGSVTVDGDKCVYKITIGGQLPAVNGSPNNIIVIEQVKVSDMKEIIDYAGRPMYTNTIPRY